VKPRLPVKPAQTTGGCKLLQEVERPSDNKHYHTGVVVPEMERLLDSGKVDSSTSTLFRNVTSGMARRSRTYGTFFPDWETTLAV
jgi:hypothetical protein